MGPIGDSTVSAIEYTLRGLAQRADVRANNVANMNTPGYRAQDVSFDDQLRTALQVGAPERAAAPRTGLAPTLPDATGNTVDLETELVGMMKDNLLRDGMVAAFNFKLGVLRTAIQGR